MKTQKWTKAAALAGASSGMLMMDGCWIGGGDSWWQDLLWGIALSAGGEFILDNDAVFDLFQDDFGSGSTYDDRFTADPTRVEPDEEAQADVDGVAGR